MKACIIQPYYSFDETDLKQCFDGMISLLEQCDESMDLIVLPEYSDVLADVKGKNGFYNAVGQYNAILLQKASETAKRCHSLVFVNAGYETENGIRNTPPMPLTETVKRSAGISRHILRRAKSRPMPRAGMNLMLHTAMSSLLPIFWSLKD